MVRDDTRPSTPEEDMTARDDQRWTDAQGNLIDEEDRGLVYDLQTLVGRRRMLGLFGGVSAAALLAACGGTGSGAAVGTTSSTSTSSDTSSSASTSTSASSEDLTEVPDETGGPYPGDGSNGVNVLDDSGIVRKDIRSSFGSSTTTATGVPLTVRLTVRDAATGDVLSGAAVYLWHCNQAGQYSLYSQGVENENYLRGVQQVGSSGTAEFTTIFPAAYSGRWPHIHFEVYSSVDDATSSGPIVKTSQIALPKEACDVVYATSGYEASVSNLARTSLTSDNVFGDDGGIHQIASMSGDVAGGYTAALTIGV
jgi:protocatechuate 3,4-dioxygenase beta subunit